MSALSDIVSKLAAPAAEAVTRAAAEFGDDAVRSIMKLNPEMRKRLAALADRQMEVAARRAKDHSNKKPVVDTVNRVAPAVNDFLSPFFGRKSFLVDPNIMDDAMHVARFGNEKEMLANIAQRAKINAAEPGDEAAFLNRLDQRKRFLQRELEAVQRYGYVNSEARALEALQGGERDYADAVLGVATQGRIPNRLMEARNRVDDLAKVFDGQRADYIRSIGPADITPALGQARLAALLRMIGDAQ